MQVVPPQLELWQPSQVKSVNESKQCFVSTCLRPKASRKLIIKQGIIPKKTAGEIHFTEC